MKGSAMRKGTKLSIGIAGAAVLFMAGWGASDILMVKRLVVMDAATDEIRVSIGTDPMGGGYIIVKDFQGNEVFSVRGNKVTTPSGTAAVGASQRTIEGVAVVPSEPVGQRPSDHAGRVMKVEGVQTRTGDPEALSKASQLCAEAEQLEAKARKKDEEAAATHRRRHPWWWYDDKDRRRVWQLEQKREREALRKLALEYRAEAKKKKGQAIRLEKKAKEPRQVIRGWDGERNVTLETTRDLSRNLRDLSPGSCLKWTGTISHSDEDSETWTVRMVELVDCPSGLDEQRPGT